MPESATSPPTAGNLVNEHCRAAGENRQVHRFFDLVAQRDEMRMHDVSEIGTDRRRDAGKARTGSDAAARLRLAHEILGRECGDDALNYRSKAGHLGHRRWRS